MSATTTISSSLTAPAAFEGGVGGEHPYSDVCHLVHRGDVALAKADSIQNLLADFLSGTARVDLVSVHYKVNFHAADQVFKIGVSEVGSSLTVDDLCLRAAGYRKKVTQFDYGLQLEGVLVPPDIYSRQIRPQSSDLPMLRLAVSASANVDVSLEFRIKVHGLRVREGSF